MELYEEQGMVYGQEKEARTGRRSTMLRAASAEYSGVRLRVVLSECKIAPMDFALFLKISPQSGRNPKWPLPQEWICTQSSCVDCEAVFAGKPAPTIGS
ncbi:hypothetical protein BFW90_09835 [Pseudomonas fluorescens]|nr:hypothetical protein BFW90_09835 [Pseudomonas fluorescens]